MGTVLGLLDLLFVAFVAVQIRYLFGGADRVVSTAGLTYAEYARRGFFELVTVDGASASGAAAGTLAPPSRGPRAGLPGAGRNPVALLFVIMASAMQRMYLYVGEYGLTQLRFYVTAFMVWLAVVLAWFILTVPVYGATASPSVPYLPPSPPSSPSTPSTPTPSSPGLTSTACRTARGSILTSQR